jgi:hypothetical protein
MRKIVFFSLMSLFCIVPPARASLITMSFSGQVDQVYESLAADFSTEDVFNGWVTFETTTPDRSTLISHGVYDAIKDFSVTVGSYTATANWGTILVKDDYGPAGESLDGFSFILYAPGTRTYVVDDSLTGADVNGMPLYSFLLSLRDSTETVFSSTDLPPAFDVSAFDGAQLRMDFIGESSTANGVEAFSFDVDFSEAPPVPEAASLFLFGIASLGTFIHTRFFRV